MKEVDCYPGEGLGPGDCQIVDGERVIYDGPIAAAPDFDDIPVTAKVFLSVEDFHLLVQDRGIH